MAAYPHREMRGLQHLLHDVDQVVMDRVQVHSLFQASRERGRGLLGVVTAAVEAAVD